MSVFSLRFFLTVLLTVFFLLGGAATLPEVQAAKDKSNFNYRLIAGRKYYSAREIADRLRLRVIKNNTRYELIGKAGRMVFNPKKRYGSFNGTVLTYNFEPVVEGNQLYISASDFFNHVQILFNPRALKPAGIRTILLDPGHGGNDKGASGVRFQEKFLNLQIAQRVQKHLSKYGYKVKLTRVNDRRMELSQRSNAANSSKADLFVSIHMNAASNRTVSGIETFALTAPGAPSSGSKLVQYNNYAGNNAANNSLSLAWFVQDAVIKATKAADRGVKHSRFVVLRETRCPAILIECGFISNRTEENKLGSAAYQEKIAKAIARGIYNYHVNLRKNH